MCQEMRPERAQWISISSFVSPPLNCLCDISNPDIIFYFLVWAISKPSILLNLGPLKLWSLTFWFINNSNTYVLESLPPSHTKGSKSVFELRIPHASNFLKVVRKPCLILHGTENLIAFFTSPLGRECLGILWFSSSLWRECYSSVLAVLLCIYSQSKNRLVMSLLADKSFHMDESVIWQIMMSSKLFLLMYLNLIWSPRVL